MGGLLALQEADGQDQDNADNGESDERTLDKHANGRVLSFGVLAHRPFLLGRLGSSSQLPGTQIGHRLNGWTALANRTGNGDGPAPKDRPVYPRAEPPSSSAPLADHGGAAAQHASAQRPTITTCSSY